MKKKIFLLIIALLAFTNLALAGGDYELKGFGPGSSDSELYEIYNKYIDSAEWVMRDDGITLSIRPSGRLRFAPQPNMHEVWGAIYYVHSTSRFWDNTDIMYKQFECHWNLAFWKPTWNLEPWKTSINGLCN